MGKTDNSNCRYLSHIMVFPLASEFKNWDYEQYFLFTWIYNFLQLFSQAISSILLLILKMLVSHTASTLKKS